MNLKQLAGLLLFVCMVMSTGCSKSPDENNNEDPSPTPSVTLSITSINPDKGDAGPLTISGKGFNAIPAANQVFIGGLPATILSGNDTKLVIDLPANLPVGLHTIEVRNNSQTASLTAGYRFTPWVVEHLAGSGEMGSANGSANEASFINPIGITTDKEGTIYVSDGNRIRKITKDGNTSHYAGSGITGLTDGIAAAARFNLPAGLVIDNNQHLYVADQQNHAIRKIDATGIVSTIAGNGQPGNKDGTGQDAQFDSPYGIAINEATQELFVADYNNNAIRKININTKEVSTLAVVNFPGGLTITKQGDLLLTEKGAGWIKKITPAGIVTTIGGTASLTDLPSFIVLDENQNLYITYKSLNQVVKLNAEGNASVFAGLRLSGDENGPAKQSKFLFPEGIAISKDENGKTIIYVTDAGNQKIKKIRLSE
jgi:DNA-binding beta-propeller fold protein YncE